MKRFALFAAMLTLGLASCGEDPVAEQEPVMVIDPTSMTIQLRSIKETFEIPVESTETVTATIGWPVGTSENDKGWLTDITSKGTRALTTSRFKFEAQKNEGSSERKATITLTMGTVSKTFSVVQGISSDIAMDLTVEQWPDGASGQIQEGGLGYRMTGISEFGAQFFVKVTSNFPWSVKFDDAASWVKQVSGGITAGGFTVEVKAARDNTIFDYANRITVVHVTLDNGAQSRDLVIQQNPRTPGSYLIDIPEDEAADQYKPGVANKDGSLAEQWKDSRIAKMILGEYEAFRNGATVVTVTNAANAKSQEFKMTARDFEAINALVPNVKILNLGKTKADSIPNNAFNRVSALQTLEEVVFPEGLDKIQAGAFKGCYKLTKISALPKTLTRIEDEAFLGAVLSESSLAIPRTLQYLGRAAFAGSELQGLSFDDPNETQVKGAPEGTLLAIPDAAFTNLMTVPNPFGSSARFSPTTSSVNGTSSSALFSISTTLNPNIAAQSGGHVNMSNGFVIPDWVSSIGKAAFLGLSFNSTASGKLTIGKNVSAIGQGAFFMCKGINSIEFKDGGVDVAMFEGANDSNGNSWDGTFGGTSITKVHYPMSSRISTGKTFIPAGFFSYCENLTEVTMENTITEIYPSAFQGSKIATGITLSTGITAFYQGAFQETELPTGTVWDLSNYGVDVDVDVIISNNFMYHSKGLKKIILPTGLKSLGKVITPTFPKNSSTADYLYLEMPTNALNCNVFSWDEAYAGGSTLEEVDLSKTKITFLQNGTFHWNKALKVVKLPSTIKYVGSGSGFYLNLSGSNKDKYTTTGTANSVFIGCSALQSIVFPASMGGTAPDWPAGVKVYMYAFGQTIERGTPPINSATNQPYLTTNTLANATGAIAQTPATYE